MEHLEQAGLDGPPKTWDELKGYAQELTRDGRYGWVLNYGEPAGIGGTASYWMVFLQQAGGKLYGDDGMPVFNDAPGIEALQLMVDMYTNGSTDPGSISYIGINDATNVLTAGNASMMMNWPFMWKPASDPATSKIVGKLGTAILPAGSAGTASIDGTDAWTIAKTSASPELAMKLIEFYLDPAVQTRQVLDTGWLPIRLSVLAGPGSAEGRTERRRRPGAGAASLRLLRHPGLQRGDTGDRHRDPAGAARRQDGGRGATGCLGSGHGDRQQAAGIATTLISERSLPRIGSHVR